MGLNTLASPCTSVVGGAVEDVAAATVVVVASSSSSPPPQAPTNAVRASTTIANCSLRLIVSPPFRNVVTGRCATK